MASSWRFKLVIDQDRAIFVADLKGVQPIRKLTFEGKSEKPLWTRDRDRQRVVFTSDREGDSSLFWQWVDGGPAERFAKIEGEIRPQAESWSPEGNVFLFSNRTGAGTVGGGLYIVSPGVNQQSKRSSMPPAGNSSLSPDGRWLAHTWFESGKSEVYVQPFPPTGEKHLITRDGGSSPLWSPDGRQLFFLRPAAATEQLVAVDVRTERGVRGRENHAASDRGDCDDRTALLRHHSRRQALSRDGTNLTNRGAAGSTQSDQHYAQLVRGTEAAGAGSVTRAVFTARR